MLTLKQADRLAVQFKEKLQTLLKIQSVIDLVSERFCHFAITAYWPPYRSTDV